MAIKIWNLETYTVQKTIMGHEHEVSSLAFLPQGDYLLSVSRDQTIKLWDSVSGLCFAQLTTGHTDWVKRVAVNNSGTLFATSSKDESIIIWNTETVL